LNLCEINSFNCEVYQRERVEGWIPSLSLRRGIAGISSSLSFPSFPRTLPNASMLYLTTSRYCVNLIYNIALTLRETAKNYLSEPNASYTFLIAIYSIPVFFVIELSWSRNIMEKNSWFRSLLFSAVRNIILSVRLSGYKMIRVTNYSLFSFCVSPTYVKPRINLFHRVQRITLRCPGGCRRTIVIHHFERKKICPRCGRKGKQCAIHVVRVMRIARSPKICFSLARIFSQRRSEYEIRVEIRPIAFWLADGNGRKAPKFVESLRCSMKKQIQSLAIELYEMSVTTWKKSGKIAGLRLSDTSLFKLNRGNTRVANRIDEHLDDARWGSVRKEKNKITYIKLNEAAKKRRERASERAVSLKIKVFVLFTLFLKYVRC